jgi:hypothetical protein
MLSLAPLVKESPFRITALGVTVFFGCFLVASVLHAPEPRVPDEFSYLLLADTLVNGHLSNPQPSMPEFFDTLHVIVHPVYVSKYFPAQGIFLALGQRLTGNPAVGIWLSSGFACAATYWMLATWTTTPWAMLGAVLMLVDWGIFSYWSQSYWGGMVAELGGALMFGAFRCFWATVSWKNSVWLALGIVILVNSRPLEGIIALLPISVLFFSRLGHEKLLKQQDFILQFALPAGIVLGCGAFLTCAYNRTITGSVWKAPYMLHEAQYQETPEFGFLPVRPKLTYSNPWLQYWYEIRELNTYRALRDPKLLPSGIARKIVTWWAFFCGLALTPAFVIPGLFRKGRIRWFQAGLLVLLPSFWFLAGPKSIFLKALFDLFVFGQIALLWFVFDTVWERLAIFTSALLILESFSVKLFFPHYFAPAACLSLYLEVSGLRRIWEWHPIPGPKNGLTRTDRRRLAREGSSRTRSVHPLRGVVYLVPLACIISLVIRVEARLQGWKSDPHGPDRQALLMDDWSLHRADLERWLEKQPGGQLVFVWYSAHHDVTQEWVYNHADLMQSHVIWAHNWGVEHNGLLLQQLPHRTVWFLDADQRNPQLIPYSEVARHALLPEVQHAPKSLEPEE